MKEIFVREDTRYNLKCLDRLNIPRVNSNTYGLKSLPFIGSQLWNLPPNEFKIVLSVSTCKDKIKSWNWSNRNSRVCQIWSREGRGGGLWTLVFVGGFGIVIVTLSRCVFECGGGDEYSGVGMLVGLGGLLAGLGCGGL